MERSGHHSQVQEVPLVQEVTGQDRERLLIASQHVPIQQSGPPVKVRRLPPCRLQDPLVQSSILPQHLRLQDLVLIGGVGQAVFTVHQNAGLKAQVTSVLIPKVKPRRKVLNHLLPLALIINLWLLLPERNIQKTPHLLLRHA